MGKNVQLDCGQRGIHNKRNLKLNFMLFEYTYLLQEFDADFFNDKSAETNEFIIPISAEIIGKKPELFQTLLSSQNRFCFCIPFKLTEYSNQYIKEEIVQNITRLLFLPNYVRINEKYIFFIERDPEKNKSPELLKNEFHDELKKQGINDIIFEILPTGAEVGNQSNEKSISFFHPELNTYLINDSPENGFEIFAKKFVFPVNFYKKWIVPVTDTANFHHKIKSITKFENWIRLADPFKTQLIEMYTAANKAEITLESENKLLKFKLENSAYSLKLMREESIGFIEEVANLRREIRRLSEQGSSHRPGTDISTTQSSYLLDNEEVRQLQGQVNLERIRANEILAWYRKEYEVLPGWYKKFGHIIKVFKGKRTFKSLFKEQSNGVEGKVI